MSKPKNLQKLSFYVKYKGTPENVKWLILGDYVYREKVNIDTERFDFEHDPRSISQIGIEILERSDHESAVIVERVELDHEPLADLDHYSVYRLKSGGVKRTYGYLDEPGVCVFKIRYNPVVHNFVLYSLPEIKY